MNGTKDFLNTLKANEHTFITVLGGGGKTSLLFFLSRASSFPSAVTTTTKMYCPNKDEMRVVLSDSFKDLEEILLSKDRSVFFAKRLIKGHKVSGYSGEFLDELFCAAQNRLFLCEGDGSRGLPFKFHAEYEPVIPKATEIAVAVVGAKALLAPMSKDTVHRLPERFEGRTLDTDLFNQWCSDLIKNKLYGGYKKILFINQAEGKYIKTARDFGGRVTGVFDAVFIGSLRDRKFLRC